MPPKQRKIALMGYRSVGKSSLTIQFVENQFVDSYDPTIENTFVKDIKVKGQDYRIQLVDTAGQDEYSIFSPSYAMDMHGYCLVYSITSPKSFEVVKVIYEKLLDMTGNIHVPIMLVGNKIDLMNERKVTEQAGQQLAQQMKANFIEVSAKNHPSVVNLFSSLIQEIDKYGLPNSGTGDGGKSGGSTSAGNAGGEKQSKCLIQ